MKNEKSLYHYSKFMLPNMKQVFDGVKESFAFVTKNV